MNINTTEPLMSYEDFVRLHGDEELIELVGGCVARYPAPHAKHGYICCNVAGIISEFVRNQGLGRGFLGDTFIRTKIDPPSCRGADFCFASYAKLPKDQRIPTGPLVVAPELVVEVRSPSDRIAQLSAKATE